MKRLLFVLLYVFIFIFFFKGFRFFKAIYKNPSPLVFFFFIFVVVSVLLAPTNSIHKVNKLLKIPKTHIIQRRNILLETKIPSFHFFFIGNERVFLLLMSTTNNLGNSFRN